MPPELLSLLLVGVRPFAAGKEATLAEEAFAAGDGERHHHPVSYLQLFVVLADLDDLAHRLVTEHVPAFHLGDDAVENVQVRAAYGASRHLDDGVSPVLNRRIGNALAADVALAVPGQCFHLRSP